MRQRESERERKSGKLVFLASHLTPSSSTSSVCPHHPQAAEEANLLLTIMPECLSAVLLPLLPFPPPLTLYPFSLSFLRLDLMRQQVPKRCRIVTIASILPV